MYEAPLYEEPLEEKRAENLRVDLFQETAPMAKILKNPKE